jgi:hypothetical protein
MAMDVKMVAYEPRAYMHDATTYDAITDPDPDHDPDHAPDTGERYGETDVSELASYPGATVPLLDERVILVDHDDRPILSQDPTQEPKMDLPTPSMPLATLPTPEAHAEKSSPAPTSSQLKSDATESGATASSTNPRLKLIPKPDREVSKHPDGKFYCAWPGCTETHGFSRRCEWR